MLPCGSRMILYPILQLVKRVCNFGGWRQKNKKLLAILSEYDRSQVFYMSYITMFGDKHLLNFEIE